MVRFGGFTSNLHWRSSLEANYRQNCTVASVVEARSDGPLMRPDSRVLDPGSTADRLFAALDGRRTSGPCGSWEVHVTGIHIVQRDAWVQVAAADQPDRSVVLHLSAF